MELSMNFSQSIFNTMMSADAKREFELRDQQSMQTLRIGSFLTTSSH